MENESPNSAAASNNPPPRPAPNPAQESDKRKWRKKRWGRIAVILLPILIIGGFLYYWFFMRPYESTDDAFIAGYVAAISPKVSGQVIKLLVQDNQPVKEGDLMVEIDPRDYEAQTAQAQAALKAAQTRQQQAQAQLTADEAKLAQEQANVVAAQAEATRAETDLKRYQSVQSPAVSRSQVDLAAAQARSNAAALEVAQSKVKAADAQTALSRAAIQTANAEVQRAEAALRQAELMLSYTKVVAPFDGFVTHRTVELGAYLQSGQNILALVPAQVWVVANYKETQLKNMRPGQPAEIHIDAYPQHTFKGHVDSIQRGSGAAFSLLPPENASGNYVKVVQRIPVKIVFDERLPSLLALGPGLSVVPKVNVLAKGFDRQQESSAAK